MSKLSLSQRAFWLALVAAAAPYAFFRLTRRPIILPDRPLAFDEHDVYDDLFDGELAAAG